MPTRAHGPQPIPPRRWKTIHRAAKDANPERIVWLTSNHINHAHVIKSDMHHQTDRIMNESGDMKRIEQVKGMIGKHTRLITCLARWNNQDATKVVPEALAAGVGLHRFAAPRNDGGTIGLETFMEKPVSELKEDDRKIAVLARAYHAVPIEAVWNGKYGFTPQKPMNELIEWGTLVPESPIHVIPWSGPWGNSRQSHPRP